MQIPLYNRKDEEHKCNNLSEFDRYTKYHFLTTFNQKNIEWMLKNKKERTHRRWHRATDGNYLVSVKYQIFSLT